MPDTTTSLWQTKLAARLHDPAEKALVLLRDPAGHENGTSRALTRLLGYATHGQPRYAVVWQEGQGTGYVIKPDASQPQDIRVQSVPVQKLQAFEVAGQASAAQLEALFQP